MKTANAPELTEVLGDLRECNSEAIHLFASIQGSGCLIAFSWPDQRVQCASMNVGDILGVPHSQVIGARLEHFLERAFVENVARQIPVLRGRQGRNLTLRLEEKVFEAYLFETEGLFALEFELAEAQTYAAREEDENDEQTVRDFMNSIKDSNTLEQAARHAAQAVRAVTGFDRVMVYRFLQPSFHGEVIGEDRIAGAHSYDKHRFPSSDIPKPARDLYLRNSVRRIPDVDLIDSRIEPALNPATRKTIDLSDSRLRSVSKIHLEYLRNMKVGASYSFAITVEGRLWGLIACHHLAPLHVPRSRIVRCEIIASAFAARSQMLEQLAHAKQQLAFDDGLFRIFEEMRSSPDPIDQLFRNHRNLENLFRVTGLALVTLGRTDLAGLTPVRSDIEAIAKYFRDRLSKENRQVLPIQKADVEGELWDRAKQMACGILGISVPNLPGGVLLLFRPELVRTITWGGDPRKQLDKKGFQGRINPRESFDTWEETVRDQSLNWEEYEIEGALRLRDFVFEVLANRQGLIEELSGQLRELRGRPN